MELPTAHRVQFDVSEFTNRVPFLCSETFSTVFRILRSHTTSWMASTRAPVAHAIARLICRPAMTTSGREECSENKCTHPKSPRARHFRVSCSTFGIDSKFMTLKVSQVSKQTSGEEQDVMPTWAIAVLIGLGALVLLIGAFA